MAVVCAVGTGCCKSVRIVITDCLQFDHDLLADNAWEVHARTEDAGMDVVSFQQFPLAKPGGSAEH